MTLTKKCTECGAVMRPVCQIEHSKALYQCKICKRVEVDGFIGGLTSE